MANSKAVTDNNTEVFKNNKRVIWLRASSLKELFDCPYRWEANNTNSGIPAIPTSIKGHTGTAVHKATEIYDKNYLGRYAPATPNDELLQRALASFKVAFDNPKFAIKDATAKEIGDMRNIGTKLVARYINEIAPTVSYSNIELKCKPMEIDVGGVILSLTGTIDRLYIPDANPMSRGVLDVKTGVQAVNAQNIVEVVAHKPQLGIYEIMGENTINKKGNIVIPVNAPARVVGMQTNGKARVAIGETMSSRDILIGTQHEAGMLQNAGRILEHKIFHGNPSSMMCNPDYCRRYKTCRYRGADALEIAEEAEHLATLAENKRNAMMTTKAVEDIYKNLDLSSLIVSDEPVDVKVKASTKIDLSSLLVHG
ncbi:MAG: PD-(D/E)XK nuclease family protein [Methylophilus sp.]|uniref:PD-(D/E)XK nuclease family protein n=1 Tax=Methylophilus sp. TaxID=29541 RepID=UPI003F9F7266